MSAHWPRSARLLASVVGRLLEPRTAEALVREIDEGYRARLKKGSRPAAAAWLRRQLVLTLRPRRLRQLRRLDALSLGAADDAGALRRFARGIALLVQDLRYSARLVVATPALTGLTVLVLAGGLGVSIFTYAFLDTVMYGALPLRDGERVVTVVAVNEAGRGIWFDAHDFAKIRPRLEGLEQIGVYGNAGTVSFGRVNGRSMRATFVEPSMFDFVGVAPILGRGLVADDARPGAEPVAVLSHNLWMSSFGGDASTLGQLIEIGGVSTRIVGIMPEGFSFPVFEHLWIPFDESTLNPVARGELSVGIYARLAPDATRRRASTELATTVSALRADTTDPDELRELPVSARVNTFQLQQMGEEGPLMFGMLHMVSAFILLLACFNAGNLLLSRALERSREITIRVALGAPRGRLVLQMMGESVLITTVSGALAVFAAGQALRIFDTLARSAVPQGLAYWWIWKLDAGAIAAAGFFVVVAILIVGGVPAWRATRADSDAALRDGNAHTHGRTIGRLSNALMVAQIAMIAVLLFLGGLTGTLSYQAANVDLGIATERVLQAPVRLPEERYLELPEQRSFFENVAEALARDPAIETVAVRGQLAEGNFAIDGATYDNEDLQPRAVIRSTHADLGTIGVTLRAGRMLDARDRPGSELSALISETLAREEWGARSPLGARVRLGAHDGAGSWHTVVGVVSDILEGNPMTVDRHARTVYVAFAQHPQAAASLAFRHRGDVRAAITAVQGAVGSVDGLLVVDDVVDIDDLLSTMHGMMMAATNVVAGCFGFALLLAIGGIYGLTARSVTHRAQEIGIRRALGATEGRVVRLFLRGGGAQLAVGLGVAATLGALLSYAVSQFMPVPTHLLVLTGLAVPALISSIVLTATYVPTRRVVRCAPRAAIWQE